MPKDFGKCESVYVQHKVNSTFKVYPDIGHEPHREILMILLPF